MEIRITSQDLGLSSRCRQFIEKTMRVIRRFIGDGVSAQIFLRRNAAVVPGKRSSARARFTLAQGEILRLLYGRPAERCCPQTYRKVRQPGA